MRSALSVFDRFANDGMPAPGRPSRITASRSASARRGMRATIDGPSSPPPPSVPWHAAQRLAKTRRPGSTLCASTRAAHATATIEAATAAGKRRTRPPCQTSIITRSAPISSINPRKRTTSQTIPINASSAALVRPPCSRSMRRGILTCRAKGDRKESCKDEIDNAADDGRSDDATIRIEEYCRNAERDLLKDGREHHEPIALDVPRNEKKCDLPGERHTDKSVEVFGVCDRRWKVSGNPRFERVPAEGRQARRRHRRPRKRVERTDCPMSCLIGPSRPSPGDQAIGKRVA